MRVLVVNAGSSSLKLSLLDGDDATLAARELAGTARTGGPGGAARRRSTRLGRGRRGRPPDRPRRRALPRGGEDRRRRRDGPARADRPRAASPAEVARRARCGHARRCRSLPAVACFDTAFHARCRRRRPPTRCPQSGVSAGGCAATAFTASRTRGSRGAHPSCWAGRCGAADRELPPGRRRLAVRDQGRDARSTRRWASPRSRAS